MKSCLTESGRNCVEKLFTFDKPTKPFYTVYLVHLMKKLTSVMPDEDILHGLPTSHLMFNSELFEMNSSSLNISKSHKSSLLLIANSITIFLIANVLERKTY